MPPHAPATCRKCWRPCYKKVEPGSVRCEECTTLLSMHPSASIRLALASEPQVPEAALRRLAQDMDLTVQLAAQSHLDRLPPREHLMADTGPVPRVLPGPPYSAEARRTSKQDPDPTMVVPAGWKVNQTLLEAIDLAKRSDPSAPPQSTPPMTDDDEW